MPPKKKRVKRRVRGMGRDGTGRYKKDCYIYNGKTKKWTLKKKGAKKKKTTKGTRISAAYLRKTRGGNIFQSGAGKKKKKKTTKKKTTKKKGKKGGNIFQMDKKPGKKPASKPAYVSPLLQQAYFTGTPMVATPVGNSTPPTSINIFQNDKTPPITFAHLEVMAHMLGKK